MVSCCSKVDFFANSFFLWLGLVFWPRLGDPCVCHSHRSLCVLFSRTGAGLYIYHLLVWSNLIFLHISQWITLPTQSCLVLYSFCANLLHSLIMWLIISSLSPHSLHLLFRCVLSIIISIKILWTCFFVFLSFTSLKFQSKSNEYIISILHFVQFKSR